MDYHASGAMPYDQYPSVSKEGDLLPVDEVASRNLDLMPLTPDRMYEIRLDQFEPELLLTVLSFIYSTEVHHKELQSGPLFNHEILVTLFNMGCYFHFDAFKVAILNIGKKELKKSIKTFPMSNPPLRLTQTQLNMLLAAVRAAYTGDVAEQKFIRGLYVHFFTECYHIVQNDPAFYMEIHRSLVCAGRFRLLPIYDNEFYIIATHYLDLDNIKAYDITN
ncbi:hypothetical protein PGQ11_010772 [Apiospora arundinis]|uniref:BTB domain-containing protein n=1 Tax=Apiospora arundinis TaxID=335852 RepID=A0ABR2IBG6_9PEZI